MPNLVTYLNWTPILEWFVVRCASKNWYQKKIGLIVQGIRCILGSRANIFFGETIGPFNEHETLHFHNEKNNHLGWKCCYLVNLDSHDPHERTHST